MTMSCDVESNQFINHQYEDKFVKDGKNHIIKNTKLRKFCAWFVHHLIAPICTVCIVILLYHLFFVRPFLAKAGKETPQYVKSGDNILNETSQNELVASPGRLNNESSIQIEATVFLNTKAVLGRLGGSVPWSNINRFGEFKEISKGIHFENFSFVILNSGFYALHVSLTFSFEVDDDQNKSVQIVVCINVEKAKYHNPDVLCNYQMVLTGGKTTISQHIPKLYLEEGDRVNTATKHLDNLYMSQIDNWFQITYLGEI